MHRWIRHGGRLFQQVLSPSSLSPLFPYSLGPSSLACTQLPPKGASLNRGGKGSDPHRSLRIAPPCPTTPPTASPLRRCAIVQLCISASVHLCICATVPRHCATLQLCISASLHLCNCAPAHPLRPAKPAPRASLENPPCHTRTTNNSTLLAINSRLFATCYAPYKTRVLQTKDLPRTNLNFPRKT